MDDGGDADIDLERDADFDGDFDDEPSTGLEVAFTPRQILGGFALCAALVLFLLRRRNRRG